MLRVFTGAKIRYLGALSAPGPALKAPDQVPDPMGGGGARDGISQTGN